jgi:hypothetical protein
MTLKFRSILPKGENMLMNRTLVFALIMSLIWAAMGVGGCIQGGFWGGVWTTFCVFRIFQIWKGLFPQKTSVKEKDLNQPIEAGAERQRGSMGINELTLRQEYNDLKKYEILRESKGEKVPNPLPPWPIWLQQQLDQRDMKIFDLDPLVHQAEVREQGREKEWLEAREAARLACTNQKDVSPTNEPPRVEPTDPLLEQWAKASEALKRYRENT